MMVFPENVATYEQSINTSIKNSPYAVLA